MKKDPRYYRPSEVDLLIGDPSKAKRVLEWEAKTRFRDLIHLMVNADIATVKESVTDRSLVSALAK